MSDRQDYGSTLSRVRVGVDCGNASSLIIFNPFQRRLMKDDDMNILKNLSTEEYKEFRRLVITMVLATDMSHHFQQINTIKGKHNPSAGEGGY